MSEERVLYGTATIKHVAKMAGVSISTVSRVINKKGGVSKELEDKIQNAIHQLKYTPNTVARALKAKSTKSIGLIIPSIENPVFPALVKVIEDMAKKYGFSIILCNSDGILEEEAKYVQLLVEKQVDGIILNAIGDYHEKFDIIRNTNTPIIVLGRKIDGFIATSITVNNFTGAYMAVEYLINTGMKNIAFLLGAMESSSAINDRFEGYKQALRDHRIRFDNKLVAKGNRSLEGGVYATEDLVKRGVSFDAVFASNDMMALGCVEKLLDSGYKVPEEISVMGYDDIPMASIFRPHLSTVRTPIQKFGKEAVKAILRIIYTKNDKLNDVAFEPELIIRETTRRI
jgi:LacI family transcriptional regulator